VGQLLLITTDLSATSLIGLKADQVKASLQ